MIRRISVRAIILNQGKLFCVRLNPYPGQALQAGEWCLPGGGLDLGESLHDGLHREMLEETGIAPIIGQLLYVQQFAHAEKDYLEFFFHVTNAADYTTVDLSKTTHGQKEIAEAAFIDPKTTKVLPTFLGTEPLEQQAASNAPTKIFSSL